MIKEVFKPVPVIANAIHDAVGIWIRKWPFIPEAVLLELGRI